MPVEFNCPHCGKLLRTPDGSEGQSGRCPHCQSVMQIPEQAPQTYFPPDPQSTYQPKPVFDGLQHRGQTVITFGILSFTLPLLSLASICCCPFIPLILGVAGLGLAIPAWLMGQADLAKIRAGQMDPAGYQLTQTGMIMGMVGCGVSALAVIVGMVFVLAIIADAAR